MDIAMFDSAAEALKRIKNPWEPEKVHGEAADYITRLEAASKLVHQSRIRLYHAMDRTRDANLVMERATTKLADGEE